jgi:prephenate dehydrogenase
MCGKEKGGLAEADAELYRGAVFALVPCSRTTAGAEALAGELAEVVGARPLFMDAKRHDRAVACISHLPYLLAAALVHTENRASLDDTLVDTLAASGFRDTSRLASSDTAMMLDILLTNRQAVERALSAFEVEIARARTLLDDPAGLRSWMDQAQQKRRIMFR